MNSEVKLMREENSFHRKILIFLAALTAFLGLINLGLFLAGQTSIVAIIGSFAGAALIMFCIKLIDALYSYVDNRHLQALAALEDRIAEDRISTTQN